MKDKLIRIAESVLADCVAGKDFRQVEYRNYPDHFGNALVVFSNGEVKLRFIRDRDELMIEVGNADSDTWWMLETVARAIGDAPMTMDKTDELKRRLPAITERFSSAQYTKFKDELRAAGEKNKQEFLKRWNSTPSQ